jgi:hypothetical protein
MNELDRFEIVEPNILWSHRVSDLAALPPRPQAQSARRKVHEGSMSKAFSRWALAALGLCGFGIVAPATAQEWPNFSSCTRQWAYDRDGNFVTRNKCDFAVEIQFMSQGDPHPVAQRLDEEAIFNSGLSKSQVDAGWWMAATCAIDFVTGRPLVPNVAFLPENKDRILAGDYKCVSQ